MVVYSVSEEQQGFQVASGVNVVLDRGDDFRPHLLVELEVVELKWHTLLVKQARHF